MEIFGLGKERESIDDKNKAAEPAADVLINFLLFCFIQIPCRGKGLCYYFFYHSSAHIRQPEWPALELVSEFFMIKT